MTVITKDNAEHYNWGDGCDGWHLAKSKMLSVIQERVPPGCSEARHYHALAEQFFFVLAGIATIEVDGVVHQVRPHSGIRVPPATPHQLKNTQPYDLEFIVVSTPPSHGDRVVV